MSFPTLPIQAKLNFLCTQTIKMNNCNIKRKMNYFDSSTIWKQVGAWI